MRFARSLFAFTVLSMLAAGGAHAQQKKQQSIPTCSCLCSAPGGTSQVTYDAIAACTIYDGKACSFLASDNLLRTGHLIDCQSGSRSGVASTSTAGVRTTPTPKPPPVTPPAGQRPAAVAK